jgi:hypothetical protein
VQLLWLNPNRWNELVRWQNDEGDTLLHKLVKEPGQNAMIVALFKKLLEYECDVTLENNNGESLLFLIQNPEKHLFLQAVQARNHALQPVENQNLLPQELGPSHAQNISVSNQPQQNLSQQNQQANKNSLFDKKITWLIGGVAISMALGWLLVTKKVKKDQDHLKKKVSQVSSPGP